VETSNDSYTDVISDGERKIIERILLEYNFKVTNFTKLNSVYKIETTEGSLCLKRIKHDKYKPNINAIIVQQLIDKGFYNITKHYKTREEKNYVKSKKLSFYLTDWIDGEEGDLNDFEEVISIVESLAKFHLALVNIDTSKLKLKNNLKNWPKIFTEHLRQLEKYERIINNKRIKREFDLSYYEYIQSMYDRGMVAINLLNKASYYNLSKHANITKALCQKNLYSQNIVKKDDGYYIIDLGNIVIDLPLFDLSNLISKLLYKKVFDWDFNKVKMIIEAYTAINKLDKKELEVMLAVIIFPYKFWKLGEKRYIKHKTWDESKYIYKLTKLIKYDALQNKFLEDYLYYINEYY
jgi:spore coat protein, CotS family